MNKKIRIYSFENQKNKFVSIRLKNSNFLYCIIKAEVRRNSQFGGIKTLGKDTMWYFSLCQEWNVHFPRYWWQNRSYRKAPHALKNKPGDSVEGDVYESI